LVKFKGQYDSNERKNIFIEEMRKGGDGRDCMEGKGDGQSLHQ